jgi:serine/threonine protein kinase/CheY-like chemotaxis protein
VNSGQRPIVFAIDDDPVILKVVAAILARRRVDCETFKSPRKALARALASPPNAIITDFHMPEMSGVELCNHLQQKLGDEAPPCLVLSANPNEEVINEAFAIGAVDYICKPVSSGELNAKLGRVLSGERRSTVLQPERRDPSTLGPFRILSRIGRGGMAIIYKVQHPEYDVPLALKALSPQSQGLAPLLRFRREIDLLAQLDHPSLVRFHHAGRVGQMPYYTMDFIAGSSLKAKLAEQQGPLSPSAVASLLYAAAAGLAQLHERQLIHRDVAPGNIMLDLDGQVRLIDFGLARHFRDRQLTSSRELLGTPHYMSPENILGQALDARSDLFSLGLVALTALLAKSPFATENPYEVMRSILAGRFPKARELPDLPKSLEQTIDAMLLIDRDARLARAGEVLHRLRPLISEQLAERLEASGTNAEASE